MDNPFDQFDAAAPTAAAAPTSGNPFDQFDKQETPKVAPPGKVAHDYRDENPSQPVGAKPGGTPPKSFTTRTVEDAAALGDMALSIPGAVAGLGANMIARVWGITQGDSHEMVSKAASEVGHDISDKVTSKLFLDKKPLSKLMTLAGKGDGYDNNDVTQVMGTAMGWLNKGGEWVQKHTGGLLTKEDVTDLVEEAMTLTGAKGVMHGAKGAATTVAEKITAVTETPTKKLNAPQGVPHEAPTGVVDTADPLAPKLKEYQEHAAKRESFSDDVAKTNESKAYDLMQRGASKREVEALRAKNPELGKTLDRMMARRNDAIEGMKYTIQGEVLGPEQLAPRGAVPKLEDATRTIDDLSGEAVKQKLDQKYLGYSPKEAGHVSTEMLTMMGAATVGAVLNPDDPIAGGLFGLAAGHLASRGIGAVAGKLKATSEFAKIGEEFWKPDPATITNPRYLQRALQWTKSASHADTTVNWQHVDTARKAGVTPEMDKRFRDYSEGSLKALPAHEQALFDTYVTPYKNLMAEELNKIKDPQERQIIGKDIETRAAKNHKAWWESIGNPAEGGRSPGFSAVASAMKSRTVYALEDGTVITTKAVEGGGYKVTAWKDNNPTVLGESKTPVTAGTEFQGMKIQSAKQADIEMHTPIRYVSSDLATHALKLAELQKYNRNKALMDDLLNSETGKQIFKKEGQGAIPEDWISPKGVEGVPQLRGIKMPPQYAEVFQDFFEKNGQGSNMMEGATNVMVRAMMLNPFPHIMNEFAHWYDSRGISGLITPTGLSGASRGLGGLITTMPDAIRSVLVQDKFQIEMQKSGGALLFPAVKNQRAWENIMQTGLKEAVKTKDFGTMAKALGTSPFLLAKRISDSSSMVMWGVRDVLYTQLVKEQIQMGKSMNDAVLDVGKHMPEYIIPSRVISEGKAGRVASEVLQSKFNVFSRYHYGLMRAVTETAKDLRGKNPGDLAKGLDRSAALLVGMAVMFPLMDQTIQQIFGDPSLHQRRSGPYHVMDSAGKVIGGEKDISALGMSLLTPNPGLMSAAEFMNNRYLGTGEPIRYTNNKIKTQAIDTGRFLASKLAPAQAAQSSIEGRMSADEYMYKQLDIIAESPKTKARRAKGKAHSAAQGRTHERKIEKDYGYENSDN